jgi:hypothetical protein
VLKEAINLKRIKDIVIGFILATILITSIGVVFAEEIATLTATLSPYPVYVNDVEKPNISAVKIGDFTYMKVADISKLFPGTEVSFNETRERYEINSAGIQGLESVVSATSEPSNAPEPTPTPTPTPVPTPTLTPTPTPVPLTIDGLTHTVIIDGVPYVSINKIQNKYANYLLSKFQAFIFKTEDDETLTLQFSSSPSSTSNIKTNVLYKKYLTNLKVIEIEYYNTEIYPLIQSLNLYK